MTVSTLLQKSISSVRLAKRMVESFGPKGRLARRVRVAKQARADSRHKYTDRPNVSVILLSFNHRPNVRRIIERLRRTRAEELIVCEDGSVDGTREEWIKHLTRPNDFMICSNDIHEIRAHNRAISMAAGDIFCILQDDDIPPEDGDWFQLALKLFAEH